MSDRILCRWCGAEIAHYDNPVGGVYMHRHNGSTWCDPVRPGASFVHQADPVRPPHDYDYERSKR